MLPTCSPPSRQSPNFPYSYQPPHAHSHALYTATTSLPRLPLFTHDPTQQFSLNKTARPIHPHSLHQLHTRFNVNQKNVDISGISAFQTTPKTCIFCKIGKGMYQGANFRDYLLFFGVISSNRRGQKAILGTAPESKSKCWYCLFRPYDCTEKLSREQRYR